MHRFRMRQWLLMTAGLCAAFSVQAGLFGDADLPKLPLPQHTNTVPQQLSLHDAIFIALRNSPDIERAELQRVLDKYDLLVEYNHFFPQYTLNAGMGLPNKGKATYSVSPGMSLNTPIGTSVSVGYENAFGGGTGVTTIDVKQPLLKGFGFAYNTIGLDNQLDAVLTDRLSYKSSVIGVVDSVITEYRTLVTDYNTVKTQENSLKQGKIEYKQNRLKYKVGQMSQSDLIQQQATMEGYRLGVVQAKNTLQRDYKSFLQTLGLDSTVKITINKTIPNTKSIAIPSVQQAIATALKSNISYQKALIGLRQTQRAVLAAKEQMKWSLGLEFSKTLGSSSTTTSANAGPDLKLNLSIPINDISDKESLLTQKIALVNARNALANQKRQLISDVTQKVEALENDKVSLAISKERVKLQARTVKDTQLQLKYGKSTMFELTTQQNTLLSQKIALISTQIGYLNDVLGLHDLLGTTLKYWGVTLKY